MSDAKPQPAKRGRPRDEDLPARRRAEIVTHAIAEFARRGYANADLDVVAANAGCSKGTLYNYFESKGALFNASVDHVMFSMVEAAGIDEQGDPLQQVEALVRGFLRHFQEHPQYVELLVQERSDFRDRDEPAYARYRVASKQKWQQRFDQLIADGRMRPMPTERAITILADLLYGTIFMNHLRGRRVPAERQASELLDLFLGGLLDAKAFAEWKQSPSARTNGT